MVRGCYSRTLKKNSVPGKKLGQNRPLKVGLEADSFEAAGGRGNNSFKKYLDCGFATRCGVALAGPTEVT